MTFDATIDVVESMGSDNFVFFTLDTGSGVASQELQELAQDSGRAEAGGAEQIVARLDAASGVKEGAPAKLWADSRSIHLFDPASGENVGLER